MIAGGWITDGIGLAIAIALIAVQRGRVGASEFAHGSD